MDTYVKIEKAAIAETEALVVAIVAEKDAHERAKLCVRLVEPRLAQALLLLKARGALSPDLEREQATLTQCLCVAYAQHCYQTDGSLLAAFEPFSHSLRDYTHRFIGDSPYESFIHQRAGRTVEPPRPYQACNAAKAEFAEMNDAVFLEAVRRDGYLSHLVRDGALHWSSRAPFFDSRPGDARVQALDAVAAMFQDDPAFLATMHVHSLVHRNESDESEKDFVRAYIREKGALLDLFTVDDGPGGCYYFTARLEQRRAALDAYMKRSLAFLAFLGAATGKSAAARFVKADGDVSLRTRMFNFLNPF